MVCERAGEITARYSVHQSLWPWKQYGAKHMLYPGDVVSNYRAIK